MWKIGEGQPQLVLKRAKDIFLSAKQIRECVRTGVEHPASRERLAAGVVQQKQKAGRLLLHVSWCKFVPPT